VREFVSGLHGKELERAVFNPTCNIGGLTAGYQGRGMKTVIPARASAKLDFRLVPDQDPEDIFARLRQHLDAEGLSDTQATWLGAMWPYKASADDPFVQLTARTAEEVYQQPFEIIPLGGGSSPVYAFAKPLGNIPVVRRAWDTMAIARTRRTSMCAWWIFSTLLATSPASWMALPICEISSEQDLINGYASIPATAIRTMC